MRTSSTAFRGAARNAFGAVRGRSQGTGAPTARSFSDISAFGCTNSFSNISRGLANSIAIQRRLMSNQGASSSSGSDSEGDDSDDLTKASASASASDNEADECDSGFDSAKASITPEEASAAKIEALEAEIKELKEKGI